MDSIKYVLGPTLNLVANNAEYDIDPSTFYENRYVNEVFPGFYQMNITKYVVDRPILYLRHSRMGPKMS